MLTVKQCVAPLGRWDSLIQITLAVALFLGLSTSLVMAQEDSDRTQQVTDLYLTALCRQLDPAGLQSWVDSDLSFEQIQAAFVTSEEGRRVAAIRALYISLLGRDPIPTDCAGIRSFVNSSLSIGEVRVAILGSAEHRQAAQAINPLASVPLSDTASGVDIPQDKGYLVQE